MTMWKSITDMCRQNEILTSGKGDAMLKLIKIAIGSAAAIFFADLLRLDYSTSAGIITLLTIQDTRRETIAITLKRICAFLLATGAAYAVFSLLGYSVISYGVFLFVFIACCMPLGLFGAASTNAVLTTHYLLEKSMSISSVGNEALLLLVGAGIGTFLNLYIPGKGREIRMMQYRLEEDLRAVLMRMSEYIVKEDKSDYTGSCFDKLRADMEAGKKQAFAYMNNTFFQESKYFLFTRREEVLSRMKDSDLPVTRQEFEERAVLYGILMDLEYFLLLKKEFADSLTKEQIIRYWQGE